MSRNTAAIEVDYISPPENTPTSTARSTSVLSSLDMTLDCAIKPSAQRPKEPIAGNWRLENLKREGSKTLATVIVTLPPDQIQMIAVSPQVVAHFNCPWANGVTKTCQIVSGTEMKIETYVPATTLLAIESLAKFGGAIAADLSEGTGPIMFET
jgi:hypothetical protein